MNRAEGFAAVPNWMIRDKAVSPRSVIVYASLASRSGLGGIHPSQQTLVDETGLSERTVRAALRDLEELGVIERLRRTAKMRGQSNRLPDGYVLHPNGKLPAEVADSFEELPATKREATGKSEQGTLLYEVEPVEVEPVYARELVIPTGFSDFWAVWPRKDAKKTAESAWGRAVKRATPAVIVAAATAYANSPHRPDKQFVPHASTWLNGDRWTDPLPEPRTAGKPTPDDRFLEGLDRGARLQAMSNAKGLGA